ncbi:hypothetical protein MTR67_012287, partial [Solanum verrucosum]
MENDRYVPPGNQCPKEPAWKKGSRTEDTLARIYNKVQGSDKVKQCNFKIIDHISNRRFTEVHYADSIGYVESTFRFGVRPGMFSKLGLLLAICRTRSAILVVTAER